MTKRTTSKKTTKPKTTKPERKPEEMSIGEMVEEIRTLGLHQAEALLDPAKGLRDRAAIAILRADEETIAKLAPILGLDTKWWSGPGTGIAKKRRPTKPRRGPT